MTKTNTHDWIMKIRPEYADCMINMGGSDYATVLGPNKEANARLIASAPALLEALEECRKHLSLAFEPSDKNFPSFVLDRADAALKLAKP